MRYGSVSLLLVLFTVSCSHQPPRNLSVCELSQDYPRFRNQVIQLRGVYYNGLRETCAQACKDGPWPSFIDLTGTETLGPEAPHPAFKTDEDSWSAVYAAEQKVRQAAANGRRQEVWVTVTGQLLTREGRAPNGPCSLIVSENDAYSGYPARLLVQRFSDVEIRDNPDSKYDYAHMQRDQ